eukprot:1341687-Alexandrium_andersonii.AAC.1
MVPGIQRAAKASRAEAEKRSSQAMAAKRARLKQKLSQGREATNECLRRLRKPRQGMVTFLKDPNGQ